MQGNSGTSSPSPYDCMFEEKDVDNVTVLTISVQGKQYSISPQEVSQMPLQAFSALWTVSGYCLLFLWAHAISQYWLDKACNILLSALETLSTSCLLALHLWFQQLPDQSVYQVNDVSVFIPTKIHCTKLHILKRQARCHCTELVR